MFDVPSFDFLNVIVSGRGAEVLECCKEFR